MKRAFTLLELLVVIGIIAILISLGAVSYSTAQKKARDAKRKTDLHAIQNTLEQYYSVCTTNPYIYPSLSGDLSGALSCATPSMTFTYPVDPLGSKYRCVGTCDSTQYTICPPVVRTGHMLEADDTCPTTGTVCCVSNQQ